MTYSLGLLRRCVDGAENVVVLIVHVALEGIKLSVLCPFLAFAFVAGCLAPQIFTLDRRAATAVIECFGSLLVIDVELSPIFRR